MSQEDSNQSVMSGVHRGNADKPAVTASNDDHLKCKRLLSRIEAARLLTEAGFPISPATLAKKAVIGGGPPYRIWNRRAMYEAGRLTEWANDQLGPELMNTAQRH
jgi:hypothetical protein